MPNIDQPLMLWPGETQAECDKVRKEWESSYDMQDPKTAALVEALIEADRMVRYNRKRMMRVEHELVAAERSGNEKEIKAARKSVEFAMRVHSAAERAFERTHKTLEQMGIRSGRDLEVALKLQLKAFSSNVPNELMKAWLKAAMGDVEETKKSEPGNPKPVQ